MKNTISYTTKGTCSRQIEIVTDGDIIESVKFIGGCSGNTQGVAALAKGMKID
ncbi:MAG: TSCPD domain-containing protein, partial [Ruminococcaceae bacterium]|nr:TSCPD domain-containing protein [Oscillospiraceae bacterium]